MNNKSIYIKDIKPGERVSDTFLVSEKNMAVSQKGNSYLSLRLRDKTGDVDGRVWDHVDEMNRIFQKGDVIRIHSRAVSFRNVIQLSISEIQALDETEIDPSDYSPTSKLDTKEMYEALMGLIETVENPHLKNLLTSTFGDGETAEAFQTAPAAKGFHHSYIGGLLEHTLSVTRLIDHVARHYGKADRDLLITGGILHDIGKIVEFSYRKMIDYTDEGRLIGHIVLGLEMVNKKIDEIEDFPEDLALELRHILLSHHGVLEYGSPKRPKTVEALIVNYMDDLDAKVNAFREYIEDSDDGSNWTPYHRLLERFIYKGK
ncbi:MAG: HD domain-containing protein [Deltaproteobacteria bacterium]|nr:HD domain-containing protein [Deltaproteobacteria bacterium]